MEIVEKDLNAIDRKRESLKSNFNKNLEVICTKYLSCIFLVVFVLMSGFLILLLLVEMWRCLCFLIREALRICFGMLQMDMDDFETFELFVYLYLYILALTVKIIIIRQEDLNDFNPSHHLI